MNRIEEKIKSHLNENKKVIACFITAGFPEIDSTPNLVIELEKAGADIIEIGMPFSDPLADGPVIQHSSQIAIENGITLEKILSQIKKIRRTSNIPIVLMGYINPIMRYGANKFFSSAVRAGADGIILPELPYEESKGFRKQITSSGLENIMLVTPTTSSKRISEIDKISSGFLYCVSITGVTGVNTKVISKEYIHRVKRIAKKNPVLVGFGIKTHNDVKEMCKYADGVIVGSAIIKKIMEGNTFEQIGEFVRELRG